MDLFTVAEVAKKLRVRKSFIYELIYTKRLKAIKMSERRIRISTLALDEFIGGNFFEKAEGNIKSAGK